MVMLNKRTSEYVPSQRGTTYLIMAMFKKRTSQYGNAKKNNNIRTIDVWLHV
jgi:hypothetical protein